MIKNKLDKLLDLNRQSASLLADMQSEMASFFGGREPTSAPARKPQTPRKEKKASKRRYRSVPDELKAQVGKLTADGRSIREIKETTGLSSTSIVRIRQKASSANPSSSTPAVSA